MLFNEPSFLFFFLPLTLLVHFLLPRPGGRLWARNVWLVIASLAFFLWREKVGLLLAPVLLNLVLGVWVRRTRGTRAGRWAVSTGVTLNLAVLVWFKYATFLLENVNAVSGQLGGPLLHLKPIALPLGISFLTFHGISYLVDVHRGDAPTEGGFLETVLYLSFFPKLIAGPIARYQDFAGQVDARTVRLEDLAAGAKRVILGLAKKTLLAGTLALTADQVFAVPHAQLTAGTAWLGALCYTLQLFLDFSGYSDIAIGLARMLGFRIQENFNYPYVSRNITEFWRRWHISLSAWFRDYLFFPLGANRGGPARGYLNLLIVFFLCGLWHGANWTFALWGLWQGIFLVLERVALGRRLARLWVPLQHVYALLVIVAGWVVFRSASVVEGLRYLATMVGSGGGSGPVQPLAAFLDARLLLAMAFGTLACTPLLPSLRKRIEAGPALSGAAGRCFALGSVAALLALFIASSMLIAAGTYNPFLYFKF